MNPRLLLALVAGCSVVHPEPTKAKCEDGFVDITEGARTVRYGMANRWGHFDNPHAYAELVKHPDGSQVFHLEARERDMSLPSLLLSLDFVEPLFYPARFDNGHAEYLRPGATSELDGLHIDAPHVVLTSFGKEGEWVEGSFGPSLLPWRRFEPKSPYRGRFRVCRAPDWFARSH